MCTGIPFVELVVQITSNLIATSCTHASGGLVVVENDPWVGGLDRDSHCLTYLSRSLSCDSAVSESEVCGSG